MDARFVVGLALTCGTVLSTRALSAQSPAVRATAAPTAEKPTSLSGCVEAVERTNEGFALPDHKNRTFHPAETNLHLYVGGRPVPVVGGLLPTTNIAAQAGSIDPTIALMATMSGNLAGTGHPRVARPRVIRLGPSGGPCTPP